MIYIDPPYNTGKDFVYRDNFRDGIGAYLEMTGQADESGKLSTNSESDGRYHSNWLNMMYPRLKLARNLLREDGVLLASIGDAEVSNLLEILDEIFGSENRLAILAWKKRGTGGQVASNAIVKQVEYILLYSRSASVKISGPNNPSAGREKWRDFRKSGGQWQRRYRPNQYYPFYFLQSGGLSLHPQEGAIEIYPEDATGEAGFWENGLETATARLKEGDFEVRSSKQGYKIYQREIAKDTSNAGTFLDISSLRGGESLKRLFEGQNLFDNPKPVELICELLVLGATRDSVILDFFAGSGTTAHAVMQLNAEDGGNRRCISVQLPEVTGEKSEARKAGYSVISQISRERIRRAGAKIRADYADTLKERETPLDTGFRAYRLVDTNFRKWHISSDADLRQIQDALEDSVDTARDEATPAELLTEVMLKLGLSLSEHVAETRISGLDVFTIGDGLMLAYLNEHHTPTLEQLRALVSEQPVKLVLLEDALKGDDQLKTNLAQECTLHDVELWTA